jgi:hypothetical protein
MLQWSDKFKYLGSHFTATCELDSELSYRIACAAAVFRRLQRPFFCQRGILLHTRLTVFVVMVLSVLLYGCESWALTMAQLHRLEVFHRGCLRQILSVRRRDRVSDAALYKRCGRRVEGEVVPLECIADHWRRRLLRWLGHVGRMTDCRIAKQMLWATLPDGVGRPGRRPPTLPQVYAQHLERLNLGHARRQYQAQMGKEGRPLFGFSWLHACADRDAWRELVG